MLSVGAEPRVTRGACPPLRRQLGLCPAPRGVLSPERRGRARPPDRPRSHTAAHWAPSPSGRASADLGALSSLGLALRMRLLGSPQTPNPFLQRLGGSAGPRLGPPCAVAWKLKTSVRAVVGLTSPLPAARGPCPRPGLVRFRSRWKGVARSSVAFRGSASPRGPSSSPLPPSGWDGAWRSVDAGRS